MSSEPIIIATWRFGVQACRTGWARLSQGASALDAVEAAANVTELDPDVNSVGVGGRPNAEGQVELDAAIMDGVTHRAGAVAGLQRIATPISVARRIMEQTPHVMVVGENARRFAVDHGFQEQDLLTEDSRRKWEEWYGVPSTADVAHFDIGPQFGSTSKYGEPHGRPHPVMSIATESVSENHDTIGLCALDVQGNLAVGCTTSGMAWKVPGRVGDSPIIGSGLYVDNEVGGAAATGHGDEMMRACVSYRVVLLMEQGRTPQEACEEALRYLLRKLPPESHNGYGAALIALRKDGLIGAAGTISGFSGPDRLWQWAVAQGPEVILNEGPYVSLATRIDHMNQDHLSE